MGNRNIDDFVPMVVFKNCNNNQYYLIINRRNNIIEVVNINDFSDIYHFELEEGNCPFEYYRIVSKEEYDNYLNKVNEFKEMAFMICK